MLIVHESEAFTQPGSLFGRLTILGSEFRVRGSNGALVRWVVGECECGRVVAVRVSDVRRGACAGCGHHKNGRPPVHGGFGTRLYRIWSGIVTRCFNERDHNYPSYGGRGVSMCSEWRGFEGFRKWAIESGYDDSLTIDREDVNGNYEPSNCRWTTVREQNRNKTTTVRMTAFGETMLLVDWARDSRCLVHVETLRRRINGGWQPETALTTRSARAR